MASKTQVATPNGLHALVIGASGIAGWAIMHEALTYPTAATFSRIIGLTNRPLTKQAAFLPDDSRLELVSGLDLAKGLSSVVEILRSINGIEKVTHVYFAAYTGHGTDHAELLRANSEILENAVKAVELVSPDLQFWTLQTGGKVYGAEYPDKLPQPVPFKETQQRIPEPYRSRVFYYAQYDLLEKLAAGKKWTFSEIRPDAIVGFVPHGNAMNIAQAIGLFLALYAAVEGPGARVPFPGSEAAYSALHTDSSQDLVARVHIFASLHPYKTARRAINAVDGEAISWAKIWPRICEYFGVEGVGPDVNAVSGVRWVQSHKADWGKHGLDARLMAATGWLFMEIMTESAIFDRQYDMGTARALGFHDSVDTVEGYRVAFDRMREAGIIP